MSPARQTRPCRAGEPRQAGFTLIEVLAAAVILVIGLGAVLSVEMSSLWANRLSRNMQNGAQVTSNALEALHRYSPQSLASGPLAPVKVENVTFQPTLAVAYVDGTMYLLTMTTTWQDDSSFLYGAPAQHTVTMQALRSALETF